MLRQILNQEVGKVKVGVRSHYMLDGAASAFDLFGIFAPTLPSNDNPADPDAQALASDWEKVGASLHRSIAQHPIA